MEHRFGQRNLAGVRERVKVRKLQATGPQVQVNTQINAKE
jgi:hypothetical protein